MILEKLFHLLCRNQVFSTTPLRTICFTESWMLRTQNSSTLLLLRTASSLLRRDRSIRLRKPPRNFLKSCKKTKIKLFRLLVKRNSKSTKSNWKKWTKSKRKRVTSSPWSGTSTPEKLEESSLGMTPHSHKATTFSAVSRVVNSLEAKSSALPSPEHLFRNQRCCSWTKPPQPSTKTLKPRCRQLSSRLCSREPPSSLLIE